MTIIAGFRCADGVVLCADTQETLGTAKRNVPKLRFEPRDPLAETEEHHASLAVAFCGAGDGPLIDKLTTEAWNAAKSKTDLATVCATIEQSIKDQYTELGRIYQRGSCPEVQLIFGAKMGGESRLFTAMGPIVNEKYEFDSGGVGHYMADFIASKHHHNDITVQQCAILAAYILFEAKKHVEGCGGESQIVILRNSGSSGSVWDHRLHHITEIANLASDTADEVFMQIADMDVDDEKAAQQINFHLNLMFRLRQDTRERIKQQESAELHKSIDLFGLPLTKAK